MNTYSRSPITGGTLLFVFLGLGQTCLHAADGLTVDQKEAFLRTAKIINAKSPKKGTTETIRVTLSDGNITHDANVQVIDDRRVTFRGESGSTIMNFKDLWQFNVAGWKMARLLGVDDMTAPTVERKYKGQAGSFTWWIDDIAMDEEDRLNKKLQAPDQTTWAKETNTIHVFTQLIYDWDANATNQLYDKEWHTWMIDFTRSFRTEKTLENPKMLTQCDRKLLAKIKTLDEATLLKELKPYVTKDEIKAMLARRDLIVAFFEAKGESGLFDRPLRQ